MNPARKKLEERVKKQLAPVKTGAKQHIGEQQVLDLLRGFIQQVNDAVNDPSAGARLKAEISLEPGHLVSKGQEYRVAIRVREIGLSDFLIRVYVPLAGYPVDLDMFGTGDRTCSSEDELIDALADLSSERTFHERLIHIRNALSDPSLEGPRAVVRTRASKNSGASKSSKKRPAA